MKGSVKFFNTKGFGFITGTDEQDYFIHQSNIKMDGFRHLDCGDFVEFESRESQKGMEAFNVQPILTLQMMKKKAAESMMHLEVKGKPGFGYMVIDQNNVIQAGEPVGLNLTDLYEYFEG